MKFWKRTAIVGLILIAAYGVIFLDGESPYRFSNENEEWVMYFRSEEGEEKYVDINSLQKNGDILEFVTISKKRPSRVTKGEMKCATKEIWLKKAIAYTGESRDGFVNSIEPLWDDFAFIREGEGGLAYGVDEYSALYDVLCNDDQAPVRPVSASAEGSLFSEAKNYKNLAASQRVIDEICKGKRQEWCGEFRKDLAKYGTEKAQLHDYQNTQFIEQLICTLPNCNRFLWILIKDDSTTQIYYGENSNIHPVVFKDASAPFYTKAPLQIHAYGVASRGEIPRWLMETFEEMNRSYVNPDISSHYIKYRINSLDERNEIGFSFN